MSLSRRFYSIAYWIGMAMSLACVVLVVAGNTELLGRFEHGGFPVSWICAGAAVLAFLVAEACHSAFSRPKPVPSPAEDRSSQLALEWEAVES
jgi:uncharacterized membrane protein YdjX (TVP38/TMEM64 family)